MPKPKFYSKITPDYAKKQIANAEKEILKIKEKISYWQKILSAFDKIELSTEDTFETQIFKRYAQVQNVKTLAEQLRAENIINQKTEKPFQSTEISQFINTTEIPDKELEWLVKTLQSTNKKHINALYN